MREADIGTFTGQVTLYVLPTHHTASTAALAHLFWTRTIPSLGLTIMASWALGALIRNNKALVGHVSVWAI